MCGIAGVWEAQDEAQVRAMMALLTDRGPDAQGLHTGPHGQLGHTRLAIMDPKGGDQPLYAREGGLAIVGNGEIYNHPGLRACELAGQSFRTGSDTETALALYARDGRDAFAALDGMFALALADGPHLVLARDPVGIKPLYLGHRGGHTLFASELKCLAGRAEAVRALPPGHVFHSADGLRPFTPLPDARPEPLPPEASPGSAALLRVAQRHAAAVRAALEAAVTKRLMSDVPLGAFLSGGLDSSVIAAIARQHVAELHTFAVGLEGSADLQAARRVAEHLGTVHHERVLRPEEALAALPQVLYAMESYDPDLVRSGLPCYLVAQEAARHVKVVLTGEGADELFAGYRYYADIPDAAALHRELHRSVAALHAMNLQRVDRLTMAHGLEGRVPFLDLEMIRTAQRVPTALKLWDDGAGRHGGSRRIEKWVLRKACEDLLPPEIVWRTKSQFDEGSGIADFLPRHLEHWLPAAGLPAYRARFPATRLESHEAGTYHKLLADCFAAPEVVLDNVVRWTDRPAHLGTAPQPVD